MNKQKKWRQIKRAERKALSPEDKQIKNTKIAKYLSATDSYQKAKRIGAYLSLPEEVGVRMIIEQAWNDGKEVYLPVVMDWGKPLQFARYTSDTPLTKDVLNIDIPQMDACDYISAECLDMVVTPLVAFDTDCNRIGMGGGFYDRTFAKKINKDTDCVLVGVAFDTQCIDGKIETNVWDVRPDMIITEKRIYRSRN